MGKGAKIEAPDFGPLADALKASSEFSFGLAQQQFDWAQKVYAENKGTSDQIIDFAMGQMDKLAAWADDDRKMYEDTYQHLEKQAAERAQDYNTPQRQEYEAGLAEAKVADEMEAAKHAARDRLEQFGVDPSQTRMAALDLGAELGGASAQAAAGNKARGDTEKYGDQLMANAINTGKGYPQQTLAYAGGAGNEANRAVNTGLAQTASGAQNMGTAPTWQQLGNQAVGMWGQTLQAGNETALNTAQYNQNRSSGIGSALGFASQFLPMLAATGGAIPDDSEGFIPPEESPSGGEITDDVEAQTPGGGPARLNAGEFVMPKRTVAWLGEKGMQAIIAKADKEMGIPEQPPAEPEMGPPPGAPPTPPRGVGAIPELEGVA